MARIYRATDLQGMAPVALKVLSVTSAADQERFRREAAMLAQVRHSGVVAYVDHGTTPAGVAYLAMAWVQGRTLADVLRTRGLSVAESVRLGRRLADALAAVHEQGIIHRDVTPKNILLPDDDVDRAVLIDFGIARAGRVLGPTRAGTLIGTVGYMSPEQARGETELDGRTDLFALGCVLFETLSGENPFPGPHAAAVRAKILLSEPAPLRHLNPEVPEALALLVAELLAKASRLRPRHAREVVTRLTDLTGLPTTRRRGGAASTPSPGAGDPVTGAEPAGPVTQTDAFQLTIVVGNAEPEGEAEDDAETPPPEPSAELKARLVPAGGALQRLEDGWLVIRFVSAGDTGALGEGWIDWVLALHRELPAHPMALSCEAGQSDVHGIDRAIDSVVQESLRALFGQQERQIRVDEPTAQLLGDRYPVERRASGTYLLDWPREPG